MEIFGLRFGEPGILWGLLAVPVLAWLYWHKRKSKPAMPVKYPQTALLKKRQVANPLRRRDILAGMTLLIIVAGFSALAQPMTVTRVAHERARVVLALDNSLSTRAVEQEDGPDRIGRMLALALEIVESARDGDELALVTFADEAFLSVEPTEDRQAIREVISSLEPEVRTDLGGALREAHRLAERTPVASHVIVISDGVASADSTPVEPALEQLAADEVAVSTVLVGTPGGFMLESGFRRPFPASPATMERIAETTGGVFVNGSAEELKEAYTNLERTVRFEMEEEPVWVFLYAVIVLLLGRTVLNLIWFRRI